MEEPDSPHRQLEPFELEACELLLTTRPADPIGAVSYPRGSEQRAVNSPHDELCQPPLQDIQSHGHSRQPSHRQPLTPAAFWQEQFDWQPASTSHLGLTQRSLPEGSTLDSGVPPGDPFSRCAVVAPSLRARSAPAAAMSSTSMAARSAPKDMPNWGMPLFTSQAAVAAHGRRLPAAVAAASPFSVPATLPAFPAACAQPSAPPDLIPSAAHFGQCVSRTSPASAAFPGAASASIQPAVLGDLELPETQHGGRPSAAAPCVSAQSFSAVAEPSPCASQSGGQHVSASPPSPSTPVQPFTPPESVPPASQHGRRPILPSALSSSESAQPSGLTEITEVDLCATQCSTRETSAAAASPGDSPGPSQPYHYSDLDSHAPEYGRCSAPADALPGSAQPDAHSDVNPGRSEHGGRTISEPAHAPSGSAQPPGLPQLQPSASQYGGRAKLQLRSTKRQALEEEAAAAAAEAPSQLVRQAAKRRPPTLQSLTEIEVAAKIESLQQPVDPASSCCLKRLDTVQRLTDLTRLPGCELSHPCDDLRTLNLQRMFVHPGWHAVVPCQSSITMVYLSLQTGNLDLRVDLEPNGRKISTMRELLQLPTEEMQQVMLSSIQTCANAKAFKRENMDGCHLSMMRSAGLLGLLCSVTVTCQQVDPSLTGQALLNMQTGHRQPPDFQEVMASLKLGPQQVILARKIWHMVCCTVNQLETERQALLSSVSPADVQPAAWQEPGLLGPVSTGQQPSYLSRVMDRAAKLTENARTQQEVVRNAARLWFWEANSPDTGARIICRSSPGCPDVFGTLRTVGST